MDSNPRVYRRLGAVVHSQGLYDSPVAENGLEQSVPRESSRHADDISIIPCASQAGTPCPHCTGVRQTRRPAPFGVGRRSFYRASDRGALLRPARLCGIELPIALFDAAGPLVSGNRGADVVRANAFACSGDFLLRLASCQGKNLIVEVRRAAAADS